MKKIARVTTAVFALLVASASTAAFAGSPVYGFGLTRAAAAADARLAAQQRSRDLHGRPNCYTPLRPNDCRRDGGEWICIIYVANHSGSCRGR
jgi:hypothetical protein